MNIHISSTKSSIKIAPIYPCSSLHGCTNQWICCLLYMRMFRGAGWIESNDNIIAWMVGAHHVPPNSSAHWIFELLRYQLIQVMCCSNAWRKHLHCLIPLKSSTEILNIDHICNTIISSQLQTIWASTIVEFELKWLIY